MSDTAAQPRFTPGPWEARDEKGAGLQILAVADIGSSLDSAGSRQVLQPLYKVSIKPTLSVGDDGRVHMLLSYEDWRQFPTVNFKEMQRANARLIASAPELFEALSALARSAESYMNYHTEKFYDASETKPTGLWPAIECARAALAKATR